jgi:alcohol dehydrogenase (NADP+)
MLSATAFAAQSAGAPLGPFGLERRDPGPRDVVLDVSHCGVCHTDIHFVNDDFGMSRYPMVPGHEIVGSVVAVGKDVHGFSVGDRAGVGCLVDSCRDCSECKAGREQFCENGFVLTYSGLEKDGKTVTQGGYSSKIVVEERFVLKVSSKLPAETQAPLLCAGITTYSPLRRFKVGAGQKVGVVGLGGLGHMGVKFAASMGAEVTVLSTSPSKKADALRLGAHDFVVTTDEVQVKRASNQFHFILDTLSAAHDYNTYVGMLKTHGVLALVGLPPKPIDVPAMPLVFGEKTITGSLIGGLRETQEMLDYCAQKNLAADVEVIPVQQIGEAYKRMLKADVKYRFVIDNASLG